ncbi:site-specific integrase [Gryllotalpicola koreensis]|uniref:Tyrosine-type recombinase/integrase n=1 Tax=Gryllotalpicola koreensis TaxID=993086 RepID=A0ABP7ZV84_9MICO
MHSNSIPITQPWSLAIEGFITHLKASGAPATTLRARREQLQHLARRAPADPWSLTADELLAYFADQTWQTETRRGRRSCFSMFWKWGKRVHGAKNIAKHLPKVKPAAPSPMPVPPPVYEAAMRRADQRTKLILRMAHDAGMRRGEIAVSASWDLVQDFVGWSLVVHGKGGKTRMVPLTPRLAFELLALGEGYFFEGAIDGHLSPRRISELAADVLDAPWTIHKLRHRFATDLLDAVGGDLLTVQEACGWAKADTARHYIPVPLDKIRQGIYRAREVEPLRAVEATA